MLDIQDSINARWIAQDHSEALAMDRQLRLAPAGVTSQHVDDLNSFCDCVEDGEGYSIPRDRMKSLRDAGLVSGGHRGFYETTDLGDSIRRAWFDDTPPSPHTPYSPGRAEALS